MATTQEEEGVQFTETHKKSAQEAFNSFDKKNQEKIKNSDIGAAMKRIGHNIKHDWLEQVNELIDEDGSGYITFDEFVMLVRKKMQEDEDERELKDVFRVLDKERKGEIDVIELRWILKSLGDDLTEEEIDDMIADTDTDGSGFVDYDEFCKLMMSS